MFLPGTELFYLVADSVREPKRLSGERYGPLDVHIQPGLRYRGAIFDGTYVGSAHGRIFIEDKGGGLGDFRDLGIPLIPGHKVRLYFASRDGDLSRLVGIRNLSTERSVVDTEAADSIEYDKRTRTFGLGAVSLVLLFFVGAILEQSLIVYAALAGMLGALALFIASLQRSRNKRDQILCAFCST
jgi:hypothetical protein